MATSTSGAAARPKAKAAPKRKSRIEQRVAALRTASRRDKAAAADEAWTWFGELSELASKDRDKAAKALNELFRLGKPPAAIDGQTEGMLVTFLIVKPVDLGLKRVTGLWMPWLGKRFDAEAKRGDNTMRADARWPMKLLWPLYGTQKHRKGRAAFDFETKVEAGKDDPDRRVLKIDYAPVDSNPGLIIRSIRDELVQIVPGANLGKILYKTGEDSYRLVGYFALRSET